MSYSKTTVITGLLVLVNIILMILLSFTPIAGVFKYIYTVPLIGVVITGVLLSVGYSVADKGINNEELHLSVLGVGIVVLTFSGIGSSILQPYGYEDYIIPLVLSGLVTTGISVICGYYVKTTDSNLERFRKYSLYSFIGVIVTTGLGLLYSPIYLISFILVLTGFISDLIYQIWRTGIGNRPDLYDGFALYVAYIGVFIQILQIIIEILIDRF